MIALCCGGCVSVAPPVIDAEVVAMSERPVVIFVSGITGVVMYDREAERVTWGDFRSAFVPRDLGYPIAQPIGEAKDRIEAREVIEEFRFGPLYRREVYRPLVTSLESNGYRRNENLFLFSYDWRRSNVESARRLVRFVDDVANARPVILLCQSNGGYLCRWAVRFGDVGLAEAELGVVRHSRSPIVDVVFLGTTHEGSIRILREVNRGRTYVPFGRFFSPEVFFTFPSLYQDLPPWRRDLFIDAEGRAVEVDLFDAREWERYGWAIFGRAASERAALRPDVFAGREERLAFLQRALDDARRFHVVLRDGPSPPELVRYHSVQSRTRRTAHRAMLAKRDGRWETLFIGDDAVDSRPELESLMTTMGDIHAGVDGQDALAGPEKARLAGPVVEVDADHLGVVQSPDSHREILRIIREVSRDANRARQASTGLGSFTSGLGPRASSPTPASGSPVR